MRFNTVVNGIVISVVIVFLVALAFRVNAGATADSVVVLKTTGMTCGSCAKSIRTTLESRKGVAITEVDVDGGWVVVGYDTRSVTPGQLAEAVSSAGYGSSIERILTPDQYRQITGKQLGSSAVRSGGCCGNKAGGCRTAQ